MPKDLTADAAAPIRADSVIIDDAALAASAFRDADWPEAADPSAPAATELGALEALETADMRGLLLENDADPDRVTTHFASLAVVVVPFPSFADGRGFSIARRLRAAGYQGRLRARGHVLSDQYAYARSVGFDEVEISAELARRQPIEDWIAAADRPIWFHRRRR